MNWKKLRSPAKATFQNPKISCLIGKSLEVKSNPNTQKNPNFESMDELEKFMS